jgi:hypothetical protein
MWGFEFHRTIPFILLRLSSLDRRLRQTFAPSGAQDPSSTRSIWRFADICISREPDLPLRFRNHVRKQVRMTSARGRAGSTAPIIRDIHAEDNVRGAAWSHSMRSRVVTGAARMAEA